MTLTSLPLELVYMLFDRLDIASCVRLSMTSKTLLTLYRHSIPRLFVPRFRRLGIDTASVDAKVRFAKFRAVSFPLTLKQSLPRPLQTYTDAGRDDLAPHTVNTPLDVGFCYIVACLAADFVCMQQISSSSVASLVREICAVKRSDPWIIKKTFVAERVLAGITFGKKTLRIILDAFGIVTQAVFMHICDRIIIPENHLRTYIGDMCDNDVLVFCRYLVYARMYTRTSATSKHTVQRNYDTVRSIASADFEHVADALLDAEIKHTKRHLFIRNPFTRRNILYGGNTYKRVETMMANECRETREAFHAYVMRSIVALNERLFSTTPNEEKI